MANRDVFKSSRYVAPVAPNTVNNAGGAAYSLSDKEALAQLVMTGTFNGTFYTTSDEQIDKFKALLDKLGPNEANFIAKLAVYARKQGFMKDTPAYLVAWLSKNDLPVFKTVFNRVIDNGKMLRNFVQIMRSGVVGRQSLGTAPKTMVKNWLANASTHQLIHASVGNSPSLADIIKMVHPTPVNLNQNALFQWILKGKVDCEFYEYLPKSIKDLLAFRSGETETVPNVPFELLTSCDLSTENWKDIARNASWQMTRMNLNTFERKGIFKDKEIVSIIANRLKDASEIVKARVFPYQIFTTWRNAESAPYLIHEALEKALDFSLQTVPVFDGKTYVFVDVSGSMSSPITGYRKGSSSNVRCVDVGALIAPSLLRANKDNVEVVMFDTRVHTAKLRPMNSVMENSATIARFGGGGTACQLPLQDLVFRKKTGDLIIYISDNESWYSTNPSRRYTETAKAWTEFKAYNPKAKMVCIDLQPGVTTQVQTDSQVLNVGGFNDAVYDVIANFASQSTNNDFWVSEIENSVIL